MGLTRSTVDNAPPDPAEQSLNDVLHWVWSWRAQLKRLVATTNAQGQGDGDIEVRQSFSLASYDEHVLVVAGWNLARAIQKAGELFPSFRIAQDKAEALRLLRHLYEHWDEQRPAFQDPAVPKERSAKRFVELFPQGRPWSITYAKDDWLLGGVVGIKAITDALVAIEEEALQLERQLLEK